MDRPLGYTRAREGVQHFIFKNSSMATKRHYFAVDKTSIETKVTIF